jgi:hypothetical protein
MIQGKHSRSFNQYLLFTTDDLLDAQFKRLITKLWGKAKINPSLLKTSFLFIPN